MAKSEPKSGAAVDSSGNIAVDPTANVLQLVDAAVRRINDLHEQELLFDAKIRDVDIKRADDLRISTIERINEALNDHKEFNKTTNNNFLVFADKLSQERELRLAQKFESLDRAIQKADAANEKRFESVNEFRSTLADQQRTLMSRMEYNSAHESLQTLLTTNNKTLSDQIIAQKERIDKLDNLKQGGQNLWVLIVGIVAIATSLVSFILGLFGK
jgi:hypothetical protein